jgi:predicted O-methyltransferase YrrM
MPKYTVEWGGASENWGALFAEFKGHAVAGLEVGTFEGKGAAWFLDTILTHPESRLTCIDTFEGSMEHSEQEKNALYNRCASNLSPYPNVTIVKGSSHDVLRTMTDRFHFIYIDGDHRAKSVLEDAVLAFRLLHYGGLMMFDDYLWQDPRWPSPVDAPKLGIDAFLGVYSGRYSVIYTGGQVVIRKIVQ